MATIAELRALVDEHDKQTAKIAELSGLRDKYQAAENKHCSLSVIIERATVYQQTLQPSVAADHITAKLTQASARLDTINATIATIDLSGAQP